MLTRLRGRLRGGTVSASAGRIFYDLSEFVAGPSRTGVQRVAYRLWREWTWEPRLMPGVIDREGTPRLLPEGFGAAMRTYFEGAALERAHAAGAIVASLAEATPIDPGSFRRFSAILNAESFHNPVRVGFYRAQVGSLGRRLHFLVHDALPFLLPELFPPGAAAQLAPYLDLLRLVPHLYFTSARTREDFCRKLLQRDLPTYRILGLGCDSLGREAPRFASSRRRFTCVGTVEPRKNHRVVLDAFEALWRRGLQIELWVIGKLGWTVREPGWQPYEMETEITRLARASPQLRWERELGDAELRRCLLESRASIYASEHEGFGLPPVESLALGVPVIVSARLPSLAGLPELGQRRLSEVTPEAVADAVQAFCDDEIAARKTEEIASLDLPSWSDVARRLHGAITEIDQPSEA